MSGYPTYQDLAPGPPRETALRMTRDPVSFPLTKRVHWLWPLQPPSRVARAISSSRDLIANAVTSFAAPFLAGSKDSSRTTISVLAAIPYTDSCDE